MDGEPKDFERDRIEKVLQITRPPPSLPLQDRLREFQLERRELLDKIKALNVERSAIEKAYDNVVQFRRQVDTQPIAPPFEFNDEDLIRDWKQRATRPTYAYQRSRSPGRPRQSVKEILQGVKHNYYTEVKSYEKLRQQVLTKKDYLTRPYLGEASLQQCEPHEVEPYLFVRSILEEEVDKILGRMFSGPYNVAKFRDDEHRSDFMALRRQTVKLGQVQLIAEQLLLEVTAELTRVIANEMIYIYKLVYEISEDFVCESLMFDGVRPVQRVQQCKRFFDDLRADREASKVGLWRHDQPLLDIRDGSQPAASGRVPQAGEDVTLIRYDFVPANLKDTDILPFDRIPVRMYKYRLLQLRDAEVAYWKQFAITSGDLAMPSEAGGVASAQYSPNANLLALGATNGDVVIAMPWTLPMRPVRGAGSQARGNPARSLAWSNDSTLLLSFHANYMVLWSTTRIYHEEQRQRQNQNQSTDVRSTVRNVTDQNLITPQQLRSIVLLSVRSTDFKFVAGPFASDETQLGKSQKWVPKRGCFSPMYDTLGAQHRFCMAMDTNDVLWVSASSLMQRAIEAGRQQAGVTNKVDYVFPTRFNPVTHTISPTHKLPCELYRRHRQEVLLMTFIDEGNEMITLDRDGYIYVWKVGQPDLNSRGNDGEPSHARISASIWAHADGARVGHSFWHQPARRHRIAMSKTAYAVIPNATKNVKFEDSDYIRALQRQRSVNSDSVIRLPNRPLVDAERDRALLEFCRMEFTGSYSRNVDNSTNVRTRVYHDSSATEANQEQTLMHLLLDDVAPSQLRLVNQRQPIRTNNAGQPRQVELYGVGPLVIAYYTQPFQPVTINALLVSCALNPTRSMLVVVLLFTETELKAAHLNVVCVNVHTMKAFEPLIELELSASEVTQIRNSVTADLASCLVHVAVTRAVTNLNTDYVLLQVAGRFYVFSLLGGKAVLRSVAGSTPIGTIADSHFGGMRASTFRVATEASERFGRLQFLLYKSGLTYVRCINFDDRNVPADRLNLSRLSQQLRIATANNGRPPEPLYAELAANQFKLSLKNYDHTLAEMRRIVYEIMDNAIQSLSGPYPASMKAIYDEQNLRYAYEYAARASLAKESSSKSKTTSG